MQHLWRTSGDPATNAAGRESLSVREILFVFDVRGRVVSGIMANVGRNEACPRGIGHKYEQWCVRQRVSASLFRCSNTRLELVQMSLTCPK